MRKQKYLNYYLFWGQKRHRSERKLDFYHLLTSMVLVALTIWNSGPQKIQENGMAEYGPVGQTKEKEENAQKMETRTGKVGRA